MLLRAADTLAATGRPRSLESLGSVASGALTLAPAGADAFVSYVERAIRRAERRRAGAVVVVRIGFDTADQDAGGSGMGEDRADAHRAASSRLADAAARRLASHYRTTDCVARLEEGFGVCVEDVATDEGVQCVTTRPLSVLGAPFAVEGVVSPAAVRVGAASAAGGMAAAALVDAATGALAAAERCGATRAAVLQPAPWAEPVTLTDPAAERSGDGAGKDGFPGGRTEVKRGGESGVGDDGGVGNCNSYDQGLLASLTPAERAVLASLCEGKSAAVIAKEFVVSLATIRSHIRAILMKLGVNSQLAAVALANRLRHEG